MPNFNRDALRRGKEAIDKANEDRQRGGDFRPFLPSIYWKDDKSQRYLLFLNTIEDIPQVEFHPFIELEDGLPHQIMCRTDQSIGERSDPIADKWQYKPRLTNLAIAAELEPVTKIVNGRPKPVGFEVKTVTFERRLRDDDGEATEEREEITAPVVGLVAQSPYNFFNQLASFDNTEAPIHTTPLKITRLGQKENVTYQVVGYEGVDLDRTNLLEYIENISYVPNPEEILELIDDVEATDASIAIGNYLLDLKLDELADGERYNELLNAITKPSRFGSKEDKKPARQARPSQRPQREPTPEHEEQVTKTSSAEERLERLRARSSSAKRSAKAKS